VVAAIADACNFVFVRGMAPDQQLINHLRRRQFLLLLDNGEYLGPGAHALAALVSQASNLKVLATSRERLQMQGEWVLEVEGLEGANGNGALASAIHPFRHRPHPARP